MNTSHVHPLQELMGTKIYFGEDILHIIPGITTDPMIVITDTALLTSHGTPLAAALKAPLLSIPSGEAAKTQRTQEYLQHALFKLGCTRNTTLIALGGGTTTDVVGFVASIYLRGVPLILIPTTLLAMVDAAIGGKTAINTSYGKNLIGTLYPPRAVCIDIKVLNTLPHHEWLNGLAEIFKLGLVADPSLLNLPKHDPTLILKAINTKIAIVKQDPSDRSLRRVLNFGHTIGHGLETLADYRLPHGLAVAIGSLVESHLSMQLGYLSEHDFAYIHSLYTDFSLKLPSSYTHQRLISAMTHDKKKSGNLLRYVLIDQVGHAMEFGGDYCTPIESATLIPSLEWMEAHYG